MLSKIGIPGLILIVLVALVAFGPKKLPELGKSMDRSLKEFKSATRGPASDDDEQPTEHVQKATVHQATATSVEQPDVAGEKTTENVSRS